MTVCATFAFQICFAYLYIFCYKLFVCGLQQAPKFLIHLLFENISSAKSIGTIDHYQGVGKYNEFKVDLWDLNVFLNKLGTWENQL